MDKNLKGNIPIYMQIMDKIRTAIVAGELLPGQRMVSVREFAEVFSVNPNTMQRALSELEREGVVVSERGNGRFVTSDKEIIEELRREIAIKIVSEFFERMKELGFTKEEIGQFFRENDITDFDLAKIYSEERYG